MYIIYVVHNTYKMTIYIQVISTFMYMYSLKRPTHAGALEIRLKKSNCIEIVDVLQQYCQKKSFQKWILAKDTSRIPDRQSQPRADACFEYPIIST